MEKNILTNEEIEDMTLEEKEENLRKLQEEVKSYYRAEFEQSLEDDTTFFEQWGTTKNGEESYQEKDFEEWFNTLVLNK